MLFTDDAGNTLGKGQAAVLVKKDVADFCDMLLCQGELCKRSGRTYLSAQGAVKFAISSSGIEAG